MYTKTVLKNGLTVLKVPIKGAQSVIVDVFVKVGSRQEDKRTNGISHFLEHLFFKGSRKYPTAMELSHALDAIGADYNANTGKEHTQYFIKAAKKHERYIFEALTDMLQHPIFDPEEIEREKGVIIEEIKMYEDTPIRHVEDILEEVMWPDQPLGRNIAGTPEAIKKISREEISKYVATYYRPKNMILSVSGAYSDIVVDRLIENHWADLANEKFPIWKSIREAQKQPQLRVESKKTEQQHLAIGFRSYDYNHKNYISQLVLATILGGSMSSRLFFEIRERRGLAYYVRASSSNYQDTGVFVIQAGIRQNSLHEAVRLIMAELRKIKEQKVLDKELNKAKEYIKGTLTLSLEDSESLLGWYLEQLAFRKNILEPVDAFALIDEVGARDVQTTAQDVFRRENLNLALIGSIKTTDEISKLLDL